MKTFHTLMFGGQALVMTLKPWFRNVKLVSYFVTCQRKLLFTLVNGQTNLDQDYM